MKDFLKNWWWCIFYAIIPIVVMNIDTLKSRYYLHIRLFWIVFIIVVFVVSVIVDSVRENNENLERLIHNWDYEPKKRWIINKVKRDIQEDREYRANRKAWFNSLSPEDKEKEIKRRKLQWKGIIVWLLVLVWVALLIYLPEILWE